MKKVYEAPEFELIKLSLNNDILSASIEATQAVSAGGDLPDDPGGEILL